MFKLIKMHNECLVRIDRIMELEGSNIVPKNAYKYCKWVDENEPELKESIHHMMRELERHFKINPRSSA